MYASPRALSSAPGGIRPAFSGGASAGRGARRQRPHRNSQITAGTLTSDSAVETTTRPATSSGLRL